MAQKKITKIETEDEEDVWGLANINKFILLVRPLRCDSLTRETSGEMLPVTPLQMKYRLSGTIHEGHRWPDVTVLCVCLSVCKKLFALHCSSIFKSGVLVQPLSETFFTLSQ